MAGGLSVESIDDYKEIEYYQSVEELMGLIEMVPLVKNFDREKDKETVEALAKRYLSKKGISKLRGITMRAHLNLVMR
jgi:hypothetical protein